MKVLNLSYIVAYLQKYRMSKNLTFQEKVFFKLLSIEWENHSQIIFGYIVLPTETNDNLIFVNNGAILLIN